MDAVHGVAAASVGADGAADAAVQHADARAPVVGAVVVAVNVDVVLVKSPLNATGAKLILSPHHSNQ